MQKMKMQDSIKRTLDLFEISLENQVVICYYYSCKCGRGGGLAMIFVSGIHGVGKSFFCGMVHKQLGINCYSASQLITTKRKIGFSENKLVPDIEDNQPLLIEAISNLRKSEQEFILDGHFCLLDASGSITRIPLKTYLDLKPDRIILLTERPEVISHRRLHRDGVKQNPSEIETFQSEEKSYAEEISAQLNIPFIVSTGADDLPRVINWIDKGGLSHGR